jgi:hypothetical protein
MSRASQSFRSEPARFPTLYCDAHVGQGILSGRAYGMVVCIQLTFENRCDRELGGGLHPAHNRPPDDLLGARVLALYV